MVHMLVRSRVAQALQDALAGTRHRLASAGVAEADRAVRLRTRLSAVGAQHRSLGAVPGRVLVVSHPCAVTVNQLPYATLVARGYDVQLVVPATWQHEYQAGPFAPEVLSELADRVHRVPVLASGNVQRHVYLINVFSFLRRVRPELLLIEHDGFSLSAAQWGVAARLAGVPYVVQAAENLDRPLPLVARVIRPMVLPAARGILARSPAAGALATVWGARGHVRLVPHAVPEWPTRLAISDHPYTVGYVGRFVVEKGLGDLVAAMQHLNGPRRLLLVGDGPMREELAATVLTDGVVEVRTGVSHDAVSAVYGEMDVLVLPSRTTPRWAEQFGRVLIEALWCGVPVVGSDSGEIPWVITVTRGGRVFPEGDVEALAKELAVLRDDASLRRALAVTGRDNVAATFSLKAAADALEGLLGVCDVSGTRSPVAVGQAS